MKPDWDKLMKEYKDDPVRLIADVDCTASGKALCDSNGVRGYPTIKHGDPSNLEDYKGGRKFDDLKKFVESLKPVCSPINKDLCSDEDKKKIDEFEALGIDGLQIKIDEGEQKIKDAEELMKKEVEKLQKKYEQLQKENVEVADNVKNSGLGLMKSVIAKLKKGGDDDDDAKKDEL